ncbi:enolase 4 isoform X4 [Mesoplodon densirostris]|uniref:enolase 4 isoform X4 n=1 Tax=Mesoplodon densirostris TaxID=48708 RepID=UPI0028DB1FD5|nr:enolase 4 isoform X4 [Mesoplodon densirostris]
MGEEGGGRSCGTTRELQKLKQQAMEYYRENDVPRRLEELLNSTFYLQPADVYGHLANCFSKLAKPPTICKVVGKNVLDGLGLPTLQVEIFCTVQNFPKNICSVVISTPFKVHENALPELVEAEELERSDAVSTAVRWVNETITKELQGLAPSNQAEVDQVLRTFFESKVQEDKEGKGLEKSLEDSTVPTPSPLTPPLPPPPPAKKKGQKQGRKDTLTKKPMIPPEPVEPILCGSMAIGAVSLAVAKTSAVLGNNPLYLNIALLKHHQDQPAKLTIPLLMVSLVSCGKSSPGKLNLMKEVICVPRPGLTAKQGVDMLLEIQKHINKTIEMSPPPKPETKKAHNGGNRGQSKGKYEVMMGTYKSAAEMVDLYVELINKFPSIIALIDPFRKEDSEQWDSTYNALGSKCYIIAGTASKSISKLLEDGNIGSLRCSGLIVKHTNQTTMSDLVEMTNLIDSKKHIAVFGSAEGESSDDSLVDLAVGLGVRFIKLGGLSRGERVTKYNRLFTIEEELVQNGTLGFNEEHTFSYLNEEAEKAAMAGELPEPLEPIFATEVVEESAKT